MTIDVRPIAETDLAEVDRVNRLAFGTLFGLSDPMKFRGDGEFVRARFHAYGGAGFVAVEAGAILGAGMASLWGSFAVLGPVMVHPEHWGRGIARRLTPALLELFERRDIRQTGLFTHPQSPKHLRLYESYGYWPHQLRAYLDKKPAVIDGDPAVSKFSAVPPEQVTNALNACRHIANATFEGLDLTADIAAVAAQGLGETLLLTEGERIAGFAVCHTGKGSEVGSQTFLVKLAFIRPGPGAIDRLRRLLSSAEALATRAGAARAVVGVNVARRDSYRLLKTMGYRTFMNGIDMLRPDRPGFNLPEIVALDDWR